MHILLAYIRSWHLCSPFRLCFHSFSSQHIFTSLPAVFPSVGISFPGSTLFFFSPPLLLPPSLSHPHSRNPALPSYHQFFQCLLLLDHTFPALFLSFIITPFLLHPSSSLLLLPCFLSCPTNLLLSHPRPQTRPTWRLVRKLSPIS